MAEIVSAIDHVNAITLENIQSTTDLAITYLKANLSSTAEVKTPDSDNYAASIKRWSTTAELAAVSPPHNPKRSHQQPQSIIVFPTSSTDISKTILCSKAHKLELAVKGGGHSTSGSSSTHGGLCIDLSKMRSVTVDVEAKTITAQGGALWSDVDSEAAKYGLAAVGGTVNHTGIGGLTLGGGYGFLTGRHGLVIDNLLEVELVLADGEVVTVSETENSDLFWAIRGAGSGFGVVTKFVYRAHEQKDAVWGGLLVFDPKVLRDVVDFANMIYEEGNQDKTVVIGFGAPPPTFHPMVIVVVFCNGPEDEAKKFYEPLLHLGPLANTTKTVPYPEVNSMMNHIMEPGFRRT